MAGMRMVRSRWVRLVIVLVFGALVLLLVLWWRQSVEARAKELLDQAYQQSEAGDLDAALATAQEAIEVAPNSRYSWCALGWVRARRHELAAAEEAYRKAIELKPDEPDLHFDLAHVLAEQGKAKEAIGEFREVLKAGHREAETREWLGVTLLHTREWDEAITHAREVLKADPSSADAHYTLGYALYARGEVDQGIAELREAVRLMPDFARAHGHLAERLREQGKLDEAAEEARRAIELGELGGPHITLGIILARRKEYAEAMEHFRAAVEIEPDNAWAHHCVAVTLAKMGKLDEAIVEHRRAVELDPDDPKIPTEFVKTLRRAKRLDEVLAEYRRAAELHPDDPKRARVYAEMLFRAERPKEAAAEYRRAAEVDPKSRRTIADAANLLIQLGQVDEAVEFLQGLESEVPDSLATWLSAGLSRALIFRGDIAQARQRLARAPTSGDSPRAHLARGQCWQYLSEWEKALAEVRRGEAASADEDLRSVTGAAALALSGRFQEAEAVVEQAGSLVTRRSLAMMTAHAYALAALGRDQEARSVLSKADEEVAWEYTGLDPLYLAGLAHRELGETEEANALFQRAIARWPKHPWSQKMRELMR
jgi:tetratricopeptide (TPR) repeat protein